MLAAQIPGALESRPPQHVHLLVTALCEIIVQRRERRVVGITGNDAAVCGESNAVGQFHSPMVGYWQPIANFGAPRRHGA